MLRGEGHFLNPLPIPAPLLGLVEVAPGGVARVAGFFVGLVVGHLCSMLHEAHDRHPDFSLCLGDHPRRRVPIRSGRAARTKSSLRHHLQMRNLCGRRSGDRKAFVALRAPANCKCSRLLEPIKLQKSWSVAYLNYLASYPSRLNVRGERHSAAKLAVVRILLREAQRRTANA